MTGSLG